MNSQTTHTEPRFLKDVSSQLARRLPVPEPWTRRLLGLEGLGALYEAARGQAGEGPIFGPLLEALGVRCECSAEDLARVPAKGPAVVVANHPFGMLEGPMLGELLLRVRPDVRFLANSLLSVVPELQPYVIAVNPFGGRAAAEENRRGLRESLEWLKGGGLLVVFPAGEVASWQMRRMRVEDAEWKTAVARMIVKTGAKAVPLYLRGANGAGFQTAGLVHPMLRTALLPRELLNKRGRTVEVRIGTPVSAERLSELGTERAATEYLRRRVQSLEWRRGEGRRPAQAPPRRGVEVEAAVHPEVLAREVGELGPEQRLLEAGGLSVFLARAEQIPFALREIGRLREVTFRAAGEGTDRATDLDEFDGHYHHLFLWNEEKREVAGAYRLAFTEEAPRRGGMPWLYTPTLFRMQPELFAEMGPAIELGRSFVREEYQRSYLPLLLLWKGIGQVVARRPECRRLFGPVSISREYSVAARELMVSFLSEHCLDRRLARHVKPRHGFRPRVLMASEMRHLAALLGGTEDLCEVVSDLETGERSIPVLLRQYLNVGGRFLAFSVDRDFSDVVDGLVVVDLTETAPKLLQRYLGKEGAERFAAFHAERRLPVAG